VNARIVWVLLASTLAVSPAPLALAAPAADHAGEIVGTWRGTSICTKIAGNESCHDEQIRYAFTRVANDTVRLAAYKLVDGEWGLMGELDFRRDDAGAWSCEFRSPRAHGIWSYRVDGTKLTGTLVLLPDKAIARNVAATRE
jgi:hypothetical protein